MTDASDGAARPTDTTITEQVSRAGPVEIAVCLLTYNNAPTVPAVVEAVRGGLAQHFAGAPAALVNADAGSSDGTPEVLAAAGLPVVLARHDVPMTERAAVPFHGVPGRAAALHLALDVAHRLGARLMLVLEADVTTMTAEWLDRLGRPVWEEKADCVLPAYSRHRYDGTITNLLLAPLIRALYGRRLRQPLPGSQALSARLVEHLLAHPRRRWESRDATDLWIVGTAIADGFSLWEAWLGRRRVESRTRTSDLPTMVAQTLGAVFTLMSRDQDLWLEVRGSEPVPAVGNPAPPATDPLAVDIERMVGAFRQGVRDLGPIWEHVLAPDTLDEVLALDRPDIERFRFRDDLWARVVYDFALGHRYGVVHREHLLRSLVPLYLGRTAAFVLATAGRDAAATEAALEAAGAAFEHQKPYLVARWR
ncbi:MAG: glycosyltransferase [Candidatus Rokuibacteriota bacterium]